MAMTDKSLIYVLENNGVEPAAAVAIDQSIRNEISICVERAKFRMLMWTCGTLVAFLGLVVALLIFQVNPQLRELRGYVYSLNQERYSAEAALNLEFDSFLDDVLELQ